MKKRAKMNVFVKPMLATSLLFATAVTPFPIASNAYAATSSYQTQMNSYTAQLVTFYNEFYGYIDAMIEEEDFYAYEEIHLEAVASYEKFLNENNAFVATLNSDIKGIDAEMKKVLNAEYQLVVAEYAWNLDDITDDEYDAAILKWSKEAVSASNTAVTKLVDYQQKHKIVYSESFEEFIGHDFDINISNYTVKKGDTLYSIAQKHGLTVTELKALNGLKSNTLKVGQVLVVQTKTTTPTTPITNTYTVKKGDTLYSIAKANGLSLNQLKTLNGLKNNTLTVGQKLKVTMTYTVKKGDTLYKIAKSHSVSVAALKKLNGLTSDSLRIGQVLVLN